jgi:hypothetical protein
MRGVGLDLRNYTLENSVFALIKFLADQKKIVVKEVKALNKIYGVFVSYGSFKKKLDS